MSSLQFGIRKITPFVAGLTGGIGRVLPVGGLFGTPKTESLVDMAYAGRLALWSHTMTDSSSLKTVVENNSDTDYLAMLPIVATDTTLSVSTYMNCTFTNNGGELSPTSCMFDDDMDHSDITIYFSCTVSSSGTSTGGIYMIPSNVRSTHEIPIFIPPNSNLHTTYSSTSGESGNFSVSFYTWFLPPPNVPS